MLLQIFILLIIVSLVLIALGLFAREHTELVLIGFFFLFSLSFILMGNSLEVHGATNSTTTYIYANSTSLALNYTRLESVDIYTPYTLSSTLSHTFGYYLAIASAVGFIMVLWNLKKSGDYKQ